MPNKKPSRTRPARQERKMNPAERAARMGPPAYQERQAIGKLLDDLQDILGQYGKVVVVPPKKQAMKKPSPKKQATKKR
jgi:hypothetical protein